MSTISKIRERNEREWHLLLLSKEAEMLSRERKHLREKARERRLTAWEMERLQEASFELRLAVQKLTTLAHRVANG